MAEKLSTGLRNYLLGEGSMRKAFEDAVIKIYSGSAPASADNAVTGVLLAVITKNSGTVSSGERSTPRVYKITVPNNTQGNTCKVNVTVDGVGPTTYTYTILAEDDTTTKVAIKIARMLNDIPQLQAIADQDAALPGVLWIQGRIDGVDITLADGGGTTTLTVTAKQAAARSNAIYFAAPVSGAMAKASEVWSGAVLVSGVAGYFRIVTSNDDGTQSTQSTEHIRLQGVVSTSGAEINLSNTSLVSGSTLTLDTFSVSLPAE